MNEKQTLIASFHKNSVEVVKLTLTEFKGKPYLDIRVYYDASENEQPDWRPSRKGICLTAELLPELMKALEKAQKALEKGQDKAESGPESVQERRVPARE